jgi:N-acyl-D-amino-acid deacylase
MIRQGVTTMVLGEGESQGPMPAGSRPWTTLGDYFDYVGKRGVATNIASYVGETRIWTYVKGEALTPASAGEIAAMKSEVKKAMEEGALGLSSSLLMAPFDYDSPAHRTCESGSTLRRIVLKPHSRRRLGRVPICAGGN